MGQADKEKKEIRYLKGIPKGINILSKLRK
jgi:hypothetical protein